MDKKTFYITTPIYYPSGKFHIGTAFTTVAADTMARYKKMKGFDTRFLTGLDEHGQKIEELAKKNNKEPQEYVDEMAKMAKDLWKMMEIENDDFIRTTEERHTKIAQNIFDKFMEQGDIYKGKYKGLYCMPCETYYTESQLVDGKCPDCGREVKLMEEEAYFFNMKKYEQKLIKFYEDNPEFLQPEFRKQEMLNNFIKPGLEDLCVSRTSFKWGIPVKKDPKHVIYVWVDALTNYITALGYGSSDDTLFKKYWPADLQIVGKDIVRFHAIYWPIFLMALKLPLPKKIYAHGFIMMKDGKMSKSKGNVIYPETLISRYGLDAVKYFLLRELPYGQDGVFSPEGFVERFNSDLCNDLGNLLNRTIAMCNKYFDGIVPAYNGKLNEPDSDLEDYAIKQIEKMQENIEELKLDTSLEEIWKLISRTNKYIDETTPWTLAKEENKEKLASVIYHLIENLRRIGIALRPFMKNTSSKILKQIGIMDENVNFDNMDKYPNIKEGTKVIEKGEPLFMRLDAEKEIEYIKEQMKNN